MKLTIFKRLTLGYAAILLLVVFLSVYVTLTLNQLNGLSREIATVHVNRLTIAEHILDKLFSQVSFEKKYLISKDADFLDKFWEIQIHLVEPEDSVKCLHVREDDRLHNNCNHYSF